VHIASDDPELYLGHNGSPVTLIKLKFLVHVRDDFPGFGRRAGVELKVVKKISANKKFA
jgi:hypothetical protein